MRWDVFSTVTVRNRGPLQKVWRDTDTHASPQLPSGSNTGCAAPANSWCRVTGLSGSVSTKLVWYPGSSASCAYSLGVEGGTLWYCSAWRHTFCKGPRLRKINPPTHRTHRTHRRLKWYSISQSMEQGTMSVNVDLVLSRLRCNCAAKLSKTLCLFVCIMK